MTYAQYCRLNVSVGAPNSAVIRKAKTRLSKLGKSRGQRVARHAWYRAILAEHADARKLYGAVVGGGL